MAIAFIASTAAGLTWGGRHGEGQTDMAKLAKISEKASEI